MANSSAMRVGITAAVHFAVAIAIVLWPVGLWAQGAVNPASQTSVAPTAQARKDFAKAKRQEVVQALGSKLAPGFNISAEGPDATYYVFHASGFSMTASFCTAILNQDLASQLRKLGFTKVVCTDNKNAKFTYDPVAQPRPVLAQTASSPAAAANTDDKSAASAAEPAKPTLPPGTAWAEGTVQGYFGPTVAQKVDARPDPAKVTSEQESALTSKSYVQIGTIRASQPGKKANSEVTQQLEAAILKKAAEAGGDVVRFSSQGALQIADVPTGKTKMVGQTCDQYRTQSVYTPATSQSCYTDVHGFQHCTTWNTPGYSTKSTCAHASGGYQVPITKKEQSLVSEGTVWRNDPKLAAGIARAEEAAREAAQKAAEALRIRKAREQEMASRPQITLNLGDFAEGVAVNPVTNKAYVALRKSIAVIDSSNDVVRTRVPVDGSPDQVAVNPVTNRIYATNPGSDNVTVIDGSTDRVSATVPVGKYPSGIAVNPTTNKIYVANKDSNDVTVIDGSTNRISATSAVDEGPWSVAVNPTTNKIYVSKSLGLAVNPVTGKIYVTSYGSSVTVLDGAADTISAKLAGGDAPKPNQEVAVIDGASNRIVTTVPVGKGARGVAVNPALNKIYVTNEYGDVENVIDGATNTTYSTGYIGKYGESVAVNPATNRVYIVQQDHVVAITDAPIGGAPPEPTISAGTILEKAIKTGDFAAVKEVLNRQPDLAASTGAEGQTPLQEAARGGSTEVVKVLLAQGADINAKELSQGETALHLAAQEGHADIVELLLAHGADVNANAKYGATPLNDAAFRGHKDVVELLLAHGANVNGGAGHDTPLQLAAEKGYKDVAELLLAHQADVNAKDIEERMPLHFAAAFRHADVVALLLAKGADVNAKNIRGETPLHLAAGSGDQDVVALLLAKGANVNAKNTLGETPMDVAEKTHRENKDLLKLLRHYGGHE
jgi:YVTN family beta-propeller protein